ncbi:fluoride efflux transporter CrcB [Intestinibacter sp.]|uniref:fluoride efflux transporter CrcB n=1 Tax=Intestinibacter sp. TaxID=1965304 RepID=UPI002A761F8D|nr:fluoride efflux transporter CrcB [Intestinibacter sp.]MDY2734700.1 fluoride efflux transporter CrcB [Intestinibacter sp.]MDY4576222.1 fluoride efflux transporter CrcB [Intestinibacter sp.]
MLEALCVGLGGFIGAISRYLISMQASKIFTGKIPVGTLCVNILGGLLIGLILELNSRTDVVSPQMKLFLTTGLMGGLTTFSTFSYETVGLFSDGSYTSAVVNIALNVVLSLIGVIIGKSIIMGITN